MNGIPNILLTIDVEDWFHVENFKGCIPYSSWPSCELRVERNTHRLLDLFDEARVKRSGLSVRGAVVGFPNSLSCNMRSTPCTGIPEQGPEEKVRTTFFILGWVADRLPHLVREIQTRGHEVASHGYYHELCSGQSCRDLEKDLCDSKKLLEDTISGPVYGYRAPSFSVGDGILKTIEECGYLYDSSYNSFAMHDRYGRVNLSHNGAVGIAREIHPRFFELPISNLNLRKPFSSGQNRDHFVLPWGGGGYFRLTPGWIFMKGVEKILSEQGAYLFYMHPWEIDPEQPRVQGAPRFYRFRHYVNLGTTEKKLFGMVRHFFHCRFVTCRDYLEHVARTRSTG
ncbi:MAG: DUF3473 domain-containing protein [Deltaproteobacteria bacterium]|nr:DUF3473 domain-containing protein [Deltaproteobacteria bacterium]